MRRASSVSASLGPNSSLQTRTWFGWMQVAPRSPIFFDRRTMRRNASISRNSAIDPTKPIGRSPASAAQATTCCFGP